MSGHSKWATIKRKKAANDSKRGKLWTKLLREITVSARMGGGDPAANPRLRAAVLEARSANVPNDTIDRAIKKGSGELEGVTYEEVTYEGYAPGGVALLVETITDNRNRTVSEVRHLFSRYGGNLGESGSVAWMFKRRGYFSIERRQLSEEAFMELALELGADDVEIGDDLYELYTSPDDYGRVQEALAAKGIPVAGKELAMLPQTYVDVGEERSAQVLRLMEALEDHEDVQSVWANFDLDESLMAASSAG
jgi:YebC/PmpR family DNA-binding regulatory protein